jgi:phosphatidylglycerophosphatase A
LRSGNGNRQVQKLLVWDEILGHHVSFTVTYRYVGLPAGIVMLVIALPFFGTLWVRSKLKNLRK